MRVAAEWLAGEWAGDAPLELAGTLVIVPTRQSGRRLREGLAALAAERGQAVFPPKVILPETLTTPGAPMADAAGRIDLQLAWIEVLRTVALEDFRSVFPVDPVERNFAWARRLAVQLIRLQGTLVESGLRIAEVPERARAAGGFPELGRWRELAELERRVDRVLAARGLRAPQAVRVAFAVAPELPPGTARIVMIGTPDPWPLALAMLERLATRVPVTVLVHGPADEAAEGLFDPWGRPRAEVWAERELAWPDFDERVRLCADPAEQVERIVALARRYERPDGVLAIGVADAEVLPPLENALARAGVEAFNPEGRPRKRDGLHALLEGLATLAADGSYEAAEALVRGPDVLAWLEAREGEGFSAARLLREIDELRAMHLPPTIEAARERSEGYPRAGRALEALAELRGRLRRGDFPENVAAALGEIFGERRIESGSALAESAVAWMELLREAGRALGAGGGAAGLSAAEKWELVLGQFAEERSVEVKVPGALDLLGWLELPWEDAPHLVVAGFNDGNVPESVQGDVFLPEGLRAMLGLKTNANRFARDAYLLAALAAARGRDGRLDILVGKTSVAGDPRRPSRLLLRCADAELPGRVAKLFREVESARAGAPWTRTWRLRPRRVAPPTRVSVTGLRDYLACPLRYYLGHVLGMEHGDPGKAELDAMDFGVLLHGALQRLGSDEALRACAEEDVLREALLGEFESAVALRYGREFTLPLVVQFESARQRLRAAAAVEARERADGWRTVRVEWAFEFPIAEGVTVRGRIDRIDRHADGRVRVLDYKSGDRVRDPAEAHRRTAKAADAERPDWLRWMDEDGREKVWTDLQLPLYRRAVAPEFGDAVGCGYFNLPKAAGDTAVVAWEGFSRALQEGAERCAKGAAEAIAAGIFWPPVEIDPRKDEAWAELFHQGAAASLEWTEEAR